MLYLIIAPVLFSVIERSSVWRSLRDIQTLYPSPAAGTKHPAAGVRLTIVCNDIPCGKGYAQNNEKGARLNVWSILHCEKTSAQCGGWDHVPFDEDGNVPTARNVSLRIRGDVQRECYTTPRNNKATRAMA